LLHYEGPSGDDGDEDGVECGYADGNGDEYGH
jgi:hypothetical protein